MLKDALEKPANKQQISEYAANPDDARHVIELLLMFLSLVMLVKPELVALMCTEYGGPNGCEHTNFIFLFLADSIESLVPPEIVKRAKNHTN